MNDLTISRFSPPETRTATPSRWRGAALALWRFAETYGSARASRELHRLALQQSHHDPELAARLRAAAHRGG